MLRTQIRDGSSLLYDLCPVYIGVNLGRLHGFEYEQPLSDYYLLKREGRYFGIRQLLVTILKHPDNYYKIIGFDVTTNEEFILSLDIHDILELINQPQGTTLVIENEAIISDFILESLVLVKKEVQTVMLCQQRLYLDDYSDLVKLANGSVSKKHTYNLPSNKLEGEQEKHNLSEDLNEVAIFSPGYTRSDKSVQTSTEPQEVDSSREDNFEVKLTAEELLKEDTKDETPDPEEVETEEYKSKHDFFVNFVENAEQGVSTCIIEGKYTSYKVIGTHLFKVSIIKLVEDLNAKNDHNNVMKRKSKLNRSKLQKNKRLKAQNELYQNSGVEEATTAFYFEASSRTLDVEYKEVLLTEELKEIIPDQSDVEDENDQNWLNYDNLTGVLEYFCDHLRLDNKKIISSLSSQKTIKREIKQEMSFKNLMNGMYMQGSGGALWTKEQNEEYKNILKKVKIEETVLLEKTVNFLNRSLDVKISVNSNSKKSNLKIYTIQVTEPSNPYLVYICKIDSRTFADYKEGVLNIKNDRACRLIMEGFSLNSKEVSVGGNGSRTQTQVERILEKYLEYPMVVVVYEQRFPHCALFSEELSNFFIIDNLTFAMFDPDSAVNWEYNVNSITPYEYFEGDIMQIYIYECIFKNLLGGICKDYKKFILLNQHNQIDRIPEDLDLTNSDQKGKQYCLKTEIFPEFDEVDYLDKKDPYYF